MKKKLLIYGCMNLGGDWNSSVISKEDEIKATGAVMTAIDSGITRFDHADIYTLGKSEQIFGTILKKHPKIKDSIRIQSKAGIELHQGYKNSNRYNFSESYILSKIEDTLRNLGIDQLDMFLFHRPDPLTHPEKTAEIMHKIKEKGYARSFGVSNMSVSLIKHIQKYSKIPIEANQIQMSLKHAELLNEIVDFNSLTTNQSDFFSYSDLNQMEIQAWGPLDQGLFLKQEDISDDLCKSETKQLLIKLSDKYSTNKSAILLAWLHKLPYTIIPVIGTLKPERIKQASESINIELSRDDWYDLWICSRANTLP